MYALSSIALSTLTALLVSPAVGQSRYDNPVDQKSYVTSGQFKTYQPTVPRDTRGQRVTTKNIVLLTGEPDLKERIKVEDLAAYIKLAEGRAYTELAQNRTPMAAMVQFNCQPARCETKLASQGQAEEATLQALYQALSELPPLKTRGEVIFQVIFNVAP